MTAAVAQLNGALGKLPQQVPGSPDGLDPGFGREGSGGHEREDEPEGAPKSKAQYVLAVWAN